MKHAVSTHSGGSSIATSFDELAKGLASGTVSRGKALRMVGGALLGAALASVPGVALADDDCSQCPEGTTCVTGGAFSTLFGCGVAC